MASNGSADVGSAANAVKGFRFRTSGKTVDWCEEMDSISPFLAAMARKVGNPEGCSVEIDESGHVLVDDSRYSSKVIGVLVAALERKKRRLNLDQLEVEDLLEYLKCADFHQLADRCNHQVCMALWTKMSSRMAQRTSVLQFKQIQFKEPLILDTLTMQRLDIEELVLHNISVRGRVSLTDVVFTDANLSLGISGDFLATRTTFKKSKLFMVCKEATLESCVFEETKWAGPAGQPHELTIKEGILSRTQLPQADKLILQSVTMTDCEIQRVGSLVIREQCSFTRTQIPTCNSLELISVDLSSIAWQCKSLSITDGTLTSVSLHCSAPLPSGRATLRRADAERLDLRAACIVLDGLNSLRQCRLHQDSAVDRWTFQEPQPAPIMASGCVFSGMTFLVSSEPLTFKDCTFCRCNFLWQMDNGEGHGTILDNCTLFACSIQKKNRKLRGGVLAWGDRTTAVDSVRAELAKNFHTPCQVLADLSVIPGGTPASHLEWIGGA